MTLSGSIRFKLEDTYEGLSSEAAQVTCLFEGDPLPTIDNSEQHTIVVDMSEDGSTPVNVQSLSSQFLVSGFEWSRTADKSTPDGHDLIVKGVSIDSAYLNASRVTRPGEGVGQRSLFNAIQTDAHLLSKRMELVKEAITKDNSKPTNE